MVVKTLGISPACRSRPSSGSESASTLMTGIGPLPPRSREVGAKGLTSDGAQHLLVYSQRPGKHISRAHGDRLVAEGVMAQEGPVRLRGPP